MDEVLENAGVVKTPGKPSVIYAGQEFLINRDNFSLHYHDIVITWVPWDRVEPSPKRGYWKTRLESDEYPCTLGYNREGAYDLRKALDAAIKFWPLLSTKRIREAIGFINMKPECRFWDDSDHLVFSMEFNDPFFIHEEDDYCTLRPTASPSWDGNFLSYYGYKKRCWYSVCAARIDPITDVEGSTEEMVELCETILNGGEVQHKRCAVRCLDDVVELWSPRNSYRKIIAPKENAREAAMGFLRRFA